MSVFGVARRLIIQLRRNPFSVAILIGLPALMIFMFNISFSTINDAGNTTYDLIVINNDKGLDSTVAESFKELAKQIEIPFNNETIEAGFGLNLLQIMNTTRYPPGENTVRIFNINEVSDIESALLMIQNRQSDILLVIPEDFSNTTLSALNNAFKIQQGLYLHEISATLPNFPVELIIEYPITSNSSIQLTGDINYLNYQISEQIINIFLQNYATSLSSVTSPADITIGIEDISLRNYSIFDTITPGIIVFALLAQGGFMSAYLSDELVTPNKTIERIRLSLLKPSEYLAGVTLVQLIITPIQLIVLFGMAYLLGFQASGSLVAAFIVYWLGSIFSLAFTFFIGGIFTNPSAASATTGFVATPIAFASGAFIELGPIILIQNIFPTPSGELRDFLLWDLLPTTHLVNAARSILLFDFTLQDVIAEVFYIAGVSLVLYILAIVFYHQRRFTGDS